MSRIFATLLLMVLLYSAACAQTSTNPPASASTSNDSTSQQSQPATIPDTAAPAQTSPSPVPEKKKSAVKRKLGQLKPDCINLIVYNHCSPPTPPEAKPTPKDVDPEYAKDMEVGDFYLNERKNYMGAAMRFHDALARKPNDPLATFNLAQSLEGLGQVDEARDQYQAYLKLEPQGQFAGDASKAVERLQGKSAVGKTKQSAPDPHQP